MSGAKIVGIRGGQAMANQSQAQPLPAPMVKLRDHVKVGVHALLRTLFENADDALFAMADKSGNNGDQAMYFDAMRELRLQRKLVATGVIKGVIQSFNEIGHYRISDKARSIDETELEELSVLQNDELEMKVAVEGMVSRLRDASTKALEELRERCEFMVAPLTLTPAQTPASPETLAECFRDGVAELDISIRARLVILKLYEKYVMAAMVKVYADANTFLVQQGILPDMKKAKITNRPNPTSSGANVQRSPEQSNRTAASQSHISDQIPTLGEDEYLSNMSAGPGSLSDLRALLHPEQRNVGRDGIDQPNHSDLPMLSNVYYSQSDLVSALSSFQTNAPQHAQGQNSAQVIDFRAMLDQRLAASGSQCKASYNEVDADIINLVSMLFDFILGDRQLQPTMKALIGRLQIPILKVAIMDRNFFNKGGHPARKLLNEIASAAIGWNEVGEGKQDRLRMQIERVVTLILEEFQSDLSIFEDLLHEFTTFMDRERRRGQLVEQRTKDSEKGKAATEHAKLQVQDVLNSALQGADAPECVVEVLRDGWSKVMVINFLKEGEDSAVWHDNCRVAAELVWTVSPYEAGVAPAVLKDSVLQRAPVVMKALDAGLQEVAFDDFKRKALLHEIEAVHVQVLQDLELAIEAESVDASQALEDDAIASLIEETTALESDFLAMQAASESVEASSPELDATNTQQEEQAEAPAERAVDAADAERAAESEAEGAIAPVEEIVLVETEPEAEEAAQQVDDNDPFVQQVDRFTVGCWFEFNQDGKTERCKLAAVIKATGKYIFVNRSGIKVAEKTRVGLAVEMRRGAVQVLNDGLLFDRALESIITNLRGKQDDE